MNVRLGLALAIVSSAGLWGCGPEEKPYKPAEVYSGKKPSLPQVPSLPKKAKKAGNAYTVWGAIHDLRSEVHSGDFEGKDTAIVGYIVKTNFDTLCADPNKAAPGERCIPKCAIHKTGKADETDCRPPVPTFWIAETKGEKDIDGKAIPVKGWASNFAQLYSFIEGLDKDDEAKLGDEFFGHDLVSPIPNTDAKVTVTGKYGFTYSKSTSGAASNPRTGIITTDTKIEYAEVPPMRAVLPGMKVRNKENKAK